MTRFLLLIILCPFVLRAQPDTLKPIGSDLLPSNYWNGHFWTSGSKIQYTYDGIDIKAKDLGKYIIASGDTEAIQEYNTYVKGRRTGGWLIAGGVLAMAIGTPIMLSNRPNASGEFTTQQPCICPTGYACGSTTTGKTVYGGQVAGYMDAPDTRRIRAAAIGGITVLTGAIMTGFGWGMQLPGRHVRRAVQYYNRALRQKGISWQVSPYSTFSNSGVGLVGRF